MNPPTITLSADDATHRQVVAYLCRLAQIAEDDRLKEYRAKLAEFREYHEATVRGVQPPV